MSNFRSHPYLYDSADLAAINITRLLTSIYTATNPLEVLELTNALTHNTTAIIEHTARTARAEGHTWQQIGDALGMTKQSAQVRFGA